MVISQLGLYLFDQLLVEILLLAKVPDDVTEVRKADVIHPVTQISYHSGVGLYQVVHNKRFLLFRDIDY